MTQPIDFNKITEDKRRLFEYLGLTVLSFFLMSWFPLNIIYTYLLSKAFIREPKYLATALAEESLVTFQTISNFFTELYKKCVSLDKQSAYNDTISSKNKNIETPARNGTNNSSEGAPGVESCPRTEFMESTELRKRTQATETTSDGE